MADTDADDDVGGVVAMTGQPRCLDCGAVLHIGPVTGELVDGWGESICSASYRAHSADVPTAAAEPAAQATNTTDRRTERGGLHSLGGAGAVPAPTVPPQGRSALSGSASQATAARGAP